MKELKGITWNHARGFDPMVATANAYMESHPDVKITWQKRSLKEFGDFPIEKLAETFDLLVIDHPFVGFGSADGCLIPLDDHLDADFLNDQAKNSVGKSHISYHYDGHQWALAIDAAAQISAYRADLLEKYDLAIPQTWDDVLKTARKLREIGECWVALPLVPIDTLMSFFSIAASTDNAPATSPDIFVERHTGLYALELLQELAEICHPKSLEWNPIMGFDAMSNTDEIAYIPLLFGYTNYGRKGFRKNLVDFTNVPKQTGSEILRGGILGGTGYAISKNCQEIDIAVEYGKFVASSDTQKGLYFESGGQPGHRAAWLAETTNAESNHFFSNTLETMDNSYLRPRYNGYMHFQETTWYMAHNFLVEKGDPNALLDKFDNIYRKTLRGTL